MAILKFTPRQPAQCESRPIEPKLPIWRPGDNAETLQNLPAAVMAARSALRWVEDLFQASEPESAAEHRYRSVAEQLELALAELQWTPEREARS